MLLSPSFLVVAQMISPDAALIYNSRIIDTYLRLLRKAYPQVDIQALLAHAGMAPCEVADPGRWFSQEQIDRFHGKLVQLSGNPHIAREAGRYAASADTLGVLRQHLLGMLGPANVFALIEQAAARVSRSARYTSRRLGRNSVEIAVVPYPGVKEKDFQCANRLGWFEAVVVMFGCEIEKIEHSECLFRNDPACRYLLTWRPPPPSRLKRLRNSGLLGFPLLAAATFLFPLTVSAWVPLLGGGLGVALLALLAEIEDKGHLRQRVAAICEETDQALVRMSANHDNAQLTNEIGHALARETSREAVLRRVVALLAERLEYDRVMIFLANHAGTRLEVRAEHGFAQEVRDGLRDFSIALDPAAPRGLLVKAFLEQKPLLVEDMVALRDSLTPEGFQLLRRLGAEAFIFSPIVCNGASLGFLAADRKTSRRGVRQTDLDLLQGVASFVGIALRNADLLETLTDQLEQIRERDQALLRHQQSLERQVADRTAELSRALSAAEAASRAKSQFLANMSHELRTPLYGVLGLNEVLLESELNSEQQRHARQMQGCGETLLRVIDDILDVSKIEAGKMELEQVPFDLRRLLGEVTDLFLPHVAARGVRLSLDPAPEVPTWVEGDSLRLRQVLLNLVGNAVKFTEEGEVALAVARIGEDSPGSQRLRFAVRDTGIGIPEEKRQVIFESFMQADGSTSRRYGGSGLGTTIAKSLVELMGGVIGCDSAPGAGSTFWFEIPLASRPQPEDRGGLVTSGEPFSLLRGRVLLVEDNPTNRDVVRRHLEQAGCRVVSAENGTEALSRLDGQNFDLVLMDVQMPGMDGCQATRLIRTGGGLSARIPIVALTANATADDHRKCLAAGMNDVLVKPLRKQTLLDRVGQWLGQEVQAAAAVQGQGEPPAGGGDPLACDEFLAELGGNRAAFDELVAGLMIDGERSLVAITECRKRGDLAALAVQAHGLKGAAGLICAYPLYHAARRLEQRAAGEDAGALDLAIGELRFELERLRAFCRKDTFV